MRAHRLINANRTRYVIGYFVPLQRIMTETVTKLTSTDWARLIQYAGLRLHRVLLNKTQINKILFYVYGVYLAQKGTPLFDDDTPKAWTYGPVFPIPNKRIDTNEEIRSFPKDKVDAYRANPDAMNLVITAVNNMYNVSAVALTKWSHEDGSPWDRTVYVKSDGKVVEQKPWNTRIDDSLIREYFSGRENRIFGEMDA